MKNHFPGYIILITLIILISGHLYAQTWKFVKERDGIRIYTRSEPDSPVKGFKGEVYLHTRMENVASMIGNVKNFDWWDDDITEIKVLLNEKDRHIRYYLVYDVPWPVTDRDLVVDAQITTDPVTGIRIVDARSINNIVPEKPDMVRIRNYWQRWTLVPVKEDLIHVILEGFVDPAGSIPAWLYNMVISDTPLKVIRSVQTHAEISRKGYPGH